MSSQHPEFHQPQENLGCASQKIDLTKLNDDEQEKLTKYMLSFFSQADGIIFENSQEVLSIEQIKYMISLF